MLCTDGQANGIGVNVLILQLFCCKLRMRRRSRVNYQALNIRYIGQQGEDLQIVDKRMRLFLSALDLEGKDRRAAIGEILLIQRMVRMIRQRRMVDMLYQRMRRQILYNLQRILYMTLQTQ